MFDIFKNNTFIKQLTKEEVFKNQSVLGVGSLVEVDGVKRCVLEVVIRKDGTFTLGVN
ncbi:hypothetical protein [Paenibacillus alvei]|uniref:hypothetical protein n=1 Tax=Paenibacillus alvei TaxID=44250 RepID=UPI0013DA4963|nr:hypothetical protein [Paenibacillus alvei]NEZ45552.1 hypothetical protein [Paenibacillus alvei]